MILIFSYFFILILMTNKIIFQTAYQNLSQQMNLSPQKVKDVYKLFWLFIREKVRRLPLKEVMTEEEFKGLKTNFNVPSLGKLYVNYKDIKKHNAKHQKD